MTDEEVLAALDGELAAGTTIGSAYTLVADRTGEHRYRIVRLNCKRVVARAAARLDDMISQLWSN